MATMAAVNEYRRTQADIAVLAERELKSFFKTLDVNDALRTKNALQLFLPELIKQYGDIGAMIAKNYYDELRDGSKAKKAYSAVLGEEFPADALTANVRWAIGPLFQKEADGAATLSNLTLVTDRAVKQVGRNTIATNIHTDPDRVGYARVPTGVHTCAFCLVLASRGAVYASMASAGENNKYHGKCDCVPTPVWEGDDLPEVDGLYEIYSNARKEAEGQGLKGEDGVLAILRKQQGVA